MNNTFPTIDEDDREKKAHRTEPCMLFKPMFDACTTKAQLTKITSQHAEQNRPEDQMEQAHRRGYEQGLTAGKSDACEMVQREMMPVVEDVQETLKQYGRWQHELVDICTLNTLKLALAIVEKISGSEAFLKLENLAEERTIIHEAMQASCGLQFCFNPQDKKIFETLSVCKDILNWEKYPQIDISENDNIDPGSVACSPKTVEWTAAHRQVAATLKKTMDANGDPSLYGLSHQASTQASTK